MNQPAHRPCTSYIWNLTVIFRIHLLLQHDQLDSWLQPKYSQTENVVVSRRPCTFLLPRDTFDLSPNYLSCSNYILSHTSRKGCKKELNHECVVCSKFSSLGVFLLQIHMKTMPAAMYRLLTAQEQPVYIWTHSSHSVHFTVCLHYCPSIFQLFWTPFSSLCPVWYHLTCLNLYSTLSCKHVQYDSRRQIISSEC